LLLILENCEKTEYAQSIRNYVKTDAVPSKKRHFEGVKLKSKSIFKSKLLINVSKNLSFESQKKPTLRKFDNPELKRLVVRKLAVMLLKLLHVIERRYRYFLPYSISAKRDDELLRKIQELSSSEKIKTALMIGVTSGDGYTESFYTGAKKIQSCPSLHCISSPGIRYKKSNEEPVKQCRKNWYVLGFGKSPHSYKELENTITDIKKSERVKSFDFILVKRSTVNDNYLSIDRIEEEIYRAMIIIIDGIDCSFNYSLYDRILRKQNFTLVNINHDLRGGYAIFKRLYKDDHD